MVKICVWNIYRDVFSGFWWRKAVGETRTSVTIVTHLVVWSEVRLQYEYLCKIQVEGLSGMTEIPGHLFKVASCYN